MGVTAVHLAAEVAVLSPTRTDERQSLIHQALPILKYLEGQQADEATEILVHHKAVLNEWLSLKELFVLLVEVLMNIHQAQVSMENQ